MFTACYTEQILKWHHRILLDFPQILFTTSTAFCFSFSSFMASLGFIRPPLNLAPPLIRKLQIPLDLYGRTFSYFGPHINICVGSSNTCVALKQFNLLPPNTLFWSNFVYHPLTNWFEAITLGWIKTCVKWFWDNFDWDWQTETWVIVMVITYNTPRTLEFKSCPVFPLWIIHWSLTDGQPDRRDGQTKKTSMLVLVTHLKRLIFNIN